MSKIKKKCHCSSCSKDAFRNHAQCDFCLVKVFFIYLKKKGNYQKTNAIIRQKEKFLQKEMRIKRMRKRNLFQDAGNESKKGESLSFWMIRCALLLICM